MSLITSDGKVPPVITGFDLEILDSELDGLNHLLFADGLLYILGSHSRLYKANVSSFKPGDAPLLAQNLDVEDKAQFILDHKFAEDTDDTHLYNMTLGPNGNLYFADAAANAIIRHTEAGAWSVFTSIPDIKNPTPDRYQGGFTTLVDINAGFDPGFLVVHHGVFRPKGFAPNTGQVRRVTATGSSVAVDGLNLPTDLKQSDAHTYCVSSLGEGSVLKVTY